VATLFEGRERAGIDPDDFGSGRPTAGKRRRGGFAVWSGTSFATPVLAGELAAALWRRNLPLGPEEAGTVLARAREAIEEIGLEERSEPGC
jgi:serine protease